MTIFTVQYRYDARSDVRDEIRPAHREFLSRLHDEGTLLASGPYAGPGLDQPAAPGAESSGGSVAVEPDGALLVVLGGEAEWVAQVLDADPFAVAGLIAARRIRPWTPVFGPWA